MPLGNTGNITLIKDFIYSLLYPTISSNVFGSYPLTKDDSWNDFVVIDCNRNTDLIAVGYATIFLQLWSRDIGTTGIENGAKLYTMETALNTILSSTSSITTDYALSRRGAYDMPQKDGFHGKLIEVVVTIFSNNKTN